MVRLILVRHGQTDANLNRMIQGQSNGSLNATGRAQVEALGRYLQGIQLDQIFASPLRRAYDTACAIAHFHKLGVVVSSSIAEWNCGALDGLPADTFMEQMRATGLPLSEFRPKGGETLTEVRQRAANFLDEVLPHQEQRTILICSHGDFLRALVSVMRGITIEEASSIHFDNASYSIVDHADGHWDITALNRTADTQAPEGLSTRVS